MWIILLLAAAVTVLLVLIVGPRSIKQNRSDSYEYYGQCYRSYRRDKKYYKIFHRKKED